MPNKAKTHEQSRRSICCVCGKTPKVYPSKKPIEVISEKQCDLVKRFVNENYCMSNPLHPTALCFTCNTTLLAHEKVNTFL